MSFTEQDIMHEVHDYFVLRLKGNKGYEVYRNDLTHSVRCAIIGYRGERGLARAIAEANKRAAQ